jgi:hypothetical protein
MKDLTPTIRAVAAATGAVPDWERRVILGSIAVVVVCFGVVMAARGEGNNGNNGDGVAGRDPHTAGGAGINDDGTPWGARSSGPGWSTVYCNCSGLLDPGYDGNGFGGPDRIVDNVSVTFSRQGTNGPDYQSTGAPGMGGWREW